MVNLDRVSRVSLFNLRKGSGGSSSVLCKLQPVQKARFLSVVEQGEGGCGNAAAGAGPRRGVQGLHAAAEQCKSCLREAHAA